MPNRIIRESCRTSPTLNALSDGAERLFWRLTTVVDDFGRFEAEPCVVLAACFPLQINKMKPALIQKRLTELATSKVKDDPPAITLYRVKRKTYLEFNAWEEHQRKRARNSKYPSPDLADTCQQMSASDGHPQANAPEKRDTRSEESRHEESRHENSADASNPKKELPPFGIEELQIMWNEIPGVIRCLEITGPVRDTLNARLEEKKTRGWWEKYLKTIQDSDYLCGRVTDWAASLDWVCGPKNMSKVVSGRYVNRPGTKLNDKSKKNLVGLKATQDAIRDGSI